MNSEHIKSKKIKYLIEKYNISDLEQISRCKYKFKIFDSIIKVDIYNFSKTLLIYEKTKDIIKEENEILLSTYVKNNNIWLKIQSSDNIIYDTNLKGYDEIITKRKEFQKIVKDNKHILLSSYINAHTKVLINYNCGHPPNLVNPYSYLQGVRCPFCSNRIVKPYINDCYTLRKDLLKFFLKNF